VAFPGLSPVAARVAMTVYLIKKQTKFMEEYNKDSTTSPVQPENTHTSRSRSGRVIGGLIVVAVGVIFLAREAGVHFPRWIFSWEMILIVLGLFLGFRHSFKNMSWLVLVLIGSVFLFDDIYPYTDISDYAWPMIIIAIGLIMIFRPGRKGNDPYWKRWEAGHAPTYGSTDDHIDSTAVFGGLKKNVISKNFKGGDVTAVFGGTDINLMQADIEGRVVLELTAVFGGIKLLVPPHWKVQTEDQVAIFGSVEDKRPVVSDPSMIDTGKVLILQGTCVFGGIDIKSY
jgi:predicted membrane protein